MQKKWQVRKNQMGDQVTQEGGMGKVYGEAITKRIQLEMKQKGRIRNNGRDVLCICVSELGMYYWRWQWVRMMNAERQVSEER